MQPTSSLSVITGEKASNTDPQLTIHELYHLNKRLHKRYIHPLSIYSLFDKKSINVFPSVTELAAGQVRGTMEEWANKQGFDGHTFRNEDMHADATLHWGAFVKWYIHLVIWL